jgi:hypothetical protein
VKLLFGFDPGGAKSFGWAVGEHSPALPLRIRGSGIADDAAQALAAATNLLEPGDELGGVGIDSPIYWTASCDRQSDRLVRASIARKGAPSPGGTVQHINSLRGACVVQGVVCGLLARSAFPGVPISEAHLKALLWLLDLCAPEHSSTSPLPIDLSTLVLGENTTSEHGRDAVIGTISAWAMLARPDGWSNLLACDDERLLPIAEPIGYWMPVPMGQV